MPQKVLVILSPGFEEIEAITVIDILRRANINVTITGLEEDLVTGSHNISVKTDIYYKNLNIDEFDFLILPGGQPGTNNMKDNSTVIDWLQKFKKENKRIAAICAAPTVLEKAKIIKNTKITSYPADKERFDPKQYSEQNVVADKNIITSRGVGTAIEFALELVEIIIGKNARLDLASKILWKS